MTLVPSTPAEEVIWYEVQQLRKENAGLRAAEDSLRAEVERWQQSARGFSRSHTDVLREFSEAVQDIPVRGDETFGAAVRRIVAERDTARTELAQTKEKLAALTETHREALINLRGYASAMRDHKVVKHVNGQLAELAAAPPEAGKEGG